MEKFTVPCVAAIIEKITNNEKYILIQTRQKEDGAETNGMLELPAGKIREYENIFETLRREVKEETGLSITKILGEDNQISNFIKGNEVISYTPYCITQRSHLCHAGYCHIQHFRGRDRGDAGFLRHRSRCICSAVSGGNATAYGER